MLICNEGPPRAGKSYDAVKTHIVPALKKGRKVYARLNGLDPEKIAEYIGKPVEEVRERLVIVPAGEVVDLLVSHGDDPPTFNIETGSLVVIDEVHEFYVSSRQPLPKEQEAFFAKHGHIGLDVVIMTQALGRLHSSIRQRIERKSVFTKLNALGRADKYAVRFYSVGDTMGKFEKISSETHEYDPAIYPLYHGFAPGTDNTEAYTEGSKTVWQVIKGPAIAVSLAVAVGVGAIGWFFSGGDIVKEPEKAVAAATPGANLKSQTAPATGAPPIARKAAPPKPKYPAGIGYVLELGHSARPRYAGVIGKRHLVEWRTAQGNALERMTSDKLESLGWNVMETPYGLLATFKTEAIVFTGWPIDLWGTQSSATAERIRAGSASLPSGGEEASRQPAAPTSGTVITATTGVGNGLTSSGDGDS